MCAPIAEDFLRLSTRCKRKHTRRQINYTHTQGVVTLPRNLPERSPHWIHQILPHRIFEHRAGFSFFCLAGT